MVRKLVTTHVLGLAVFLSLTIASEFFETEGLTATSMASELTFLFEDQDLQRLGEKVFFDENLSTPPGQSCAVCHRPEAGWTGPVEKINQGGAVYAGAIPERFGNRKPSSAAYATSAPFLHLEEEDGERLFVGGNFWDGRATGWILGNAAADQAQGPFLNPVEQNNPDAKSVVGKVCQSDYADLFLKICTRIRGRKDIHSEEDFEPAFGIIALAIAAFENSEKVNPFNSKYDFYLRGTVDLTPQEKRGLDLFEGKGKCAECHPHKLGPNGEPPLFTDFTYDNLGFPRNPLNPWYRMPPAYNSDGRAWVDPGLGGFLSQVPQYAMLAPENLGKHRVPTLRNVDKRPCPTFVKAYGHNGYFKNLKDIVHFYNTRDVFPRCDVMPDAQPGANCWPEPEVPGNINREELGDLKLTAAEEADIVVFMETLSVGYSMPGSLAKDDAVGPGSLSTRVRSTHRTGHMANPFNRGGQMDRAYCLPWVVMLLLVAGCRSLDGVTPVDVSEPVCIQGTVWYQVLDEGTRVPYPHASITAWRHGTRVGLAETKADAAGRYCIEVPRGERDVDLRVFGLIRLQNKAYTCKGETQHIDPGTATRPCGADCVRVDIETECQEYQPPRHRQI